MKAVALSRDGTRQSHIVTKSFEVEKHDHNDNLENSQLNKTGYEFIDELERERKREIVKKRGILKKIVDTNNLSYRSGKQSQLIPIRLVKKKLLFFFVQRVVEVIMKAQGTITKQQPTLEIDFQTKI